jgi:hypothetical protein
VAGHEAIEAAEEARLVTAIGLAVGGPPEAVRAWLNRRDRPPGRDGRRRAGEGPRSADEIEVDWA